MIWAWEFSRSICKKNTGSWLEPVFFILLGPGGKVIRRNGNYHGSCNFNLTNCLMKSIVPSIPNTDESMHR